MNERKRETTGKGGKGSPSRTSWTKTRAHCEEGGRGPKTKYKGSRGTGCGLGAAWTVQKRNVKKVGKRKEPSVKTTTSIDPIKSHFIDSREGKQ